jgi:Transposase DDE domain
MVDRPKSKARTHDITQTETLVAGIHGAFILADKGYDSKKVIELIESLGCVAVVPA